MMFGYKDEFSYFECAGCGCLQIAKIPADLSKYYPKDYWPHTESEPTYPMGARESFVRRQVTKYYLTRKNVLGRLLDKRHDLGREYPEWLKRKSVNLNLNIASHILDVGCGSGGLLIDLQRKGFSRLCGVDLYIDGNITYKSGVRIIKSDLESLDQQFDFIMLHHSFEHMPEPLHTLETLYRLLKPNRYILLRMPLASSFAWRKYGVDWVQLDAPRHLFLHTTRSLEVLARKSGFRVAEVIFDSDEFQFWGSEQYQSGIPLRDERSHWVNPSQSIFSEQEIDAYSRLAAELNDRMEGDQACFYLYKE